MQERRSNFLELMVCIIRIQDATVALEDREPPFKLMGVASLGTSLMISDWWGKGYHGRARPCGPSSSPWARRWTAIIA